MKYVKFEFSAGLCGTDTYMYGKFDDSATEEEIDEVALDLVADHCESYGIDIEEEEEKSGVEWEYDYSWKYVNKEEVEENNLQDYT